MVATEVALTSVVIAPDSCIKDAATIRTEALDHLMEGKRNFLCEDYADSVSSLAMACELLSKQFGETANECADSYFHYGKALLELARMESAVLGNALEGVPEGDDTESPQVENTETMTENEKEEIGTEVMEALEENFVEHEEKVASLINSHTKAVDCDEVEEAQESMDVDKETGKKSEDKAEEKSISDMEVDKKPGDKAEEKSANDMEVEKKPEDKAEERSANDMEAEKKPEEKMEEKLAEDIEAEIENEDLSNLQRAWEVLELAKVIYTRMIKEAKTEVGEKKLCETLLSLGEVSIENENWSQAVEDFQACLEKRNELSHDARSIAETHYQLSVALGYHSKFDEAVQALNDAKDVLASHLAVLKADTFNARVSEIDELQQLLPEIEERIQDTIEMKAHSEKFKESMGGFPKSTMGSKPATAIETKKK